MFLKLRLGTPGIVGEERDRYIHCSPITRGHYQALAPAGCIRAGAREQFHFYEL